MHIELEALEKCKAWKIVDLPKGKKPYIADRFIKFRQKMMGH